MYFLAQITGTIHQKGCENQCLNKTKRYISYWVLGTGFACMSIRIPITTGNINISHGTIRSCLRVTAIKNIFKHAHTKKTRFEKTDIQHNIVYMRETRREQCGYVACWHTITLYNSPLKPNSCKTGARLQHSLENRA